jgi:hypothetical protein
MPSESGTIVHEQTASRGPRGGRGRIRDGAPRVAAEETGDGFLRDQRRHAARDEERRQQAQQHVRSQVGGGSRPLDQLRDQRKSGIHPVNCACKEAGGR